MLIIDKFRNSIEKKNEIITTIDVQPGALIIPIILREKNKAANIKENKLINKPSNAE